MRHRLHVLLDEHEMAEVRAAARRRGLTLSEYVRTTLREARLGAPGVRAERKLLALREATAHAFPTTGPGEMEAEIRRGYLGPR